MRRRSLRIALLLLLAVLALATAAGWVALYLSQTQPDRGEPVAAIIAAGARG